MHGFRCCDNIHVCKLIASSTANAYSAEREMSASACTRSVANTDYINVTLPFFMHPHCMYSKTRMWANAQRDGRPAEHRWRPLFIAAKFG